MDASEAVELGRQAVMTAFLIGSPILLVGATVGLLIGLVQALTQIQDQTISFVPKIVAMIVALSICMPWILQEMIEYSQTLITEIPRTVLK